MGFFGGRLRSFFLARFLKAPFRSQMAQIRRDIRDFWASSGVDQVIVLWTANTERFCEVRPGVNDTAENLLRAIEVRMGGWGGSMLFFLLLSRLPSAFTIGSHNPDPFE